MADPSTAGADLYQLHYHVAVYMQLPLSPETTVVQANDQVRAVIEGALRSELWPLLAVHRTEVRAVSADPGTAGAGLDLESLKALAEKATPGPWNSARDPGASEWFVDRMVASDDGEDEYEQIARRVKTSADAAFIAAAREAVPSLIAEIERLRGGAVPDAVRDALEHEAERLETSPLLYRDGWAKRAATIRAFLAAAGSAPPAVDGKAQ